MTVPDEALPQTDPFCDVLVVGGGPAGSTIAALLSERGYHVVLVEKEKHPRFHIGESLLPLNVPLFDRLGVRDEIERIGMRKHGAEFVSPYHGKTVKFDFANAWDKEFPYAYQVRRSEFDYVLLKNAVAKGAKVIEECRISDVEFLPEGGAVATGKDGGDQIRTWRTRFFVDATGRDTLLANRLAIKKRNPKHNSAAMFGHFTGAYRPSGKEAGNIVLFWFDHGWFWFIPLADGTTSIGAVCWRYYMKSRKTDPTTFFADTIKMCPQIADRLKGATLVTPVWSTGNYSYRAEKMTGQSYIMLGDAFAFIDPVFSTGVYLAMNSALLGAEAVDTCLRQPHKAARALRRFDSEVRRGLDTFSWYIYRVTTPALRNLLMKPRNYFRVEDALLSLLAGDIFGRTPIRPSLAVFKSFYYYNSLLHLRTSFAAWRRRKLAIGSPADEAGSSA